MKPRQVHVLDAVNEIQKKQGFCRVSDISSYMNTTLPSITKLVQELEERNLLVKQADEKDKRVINLTLTEEGKEFVELRVTHFHGEWASACQIWTTRWWTNLCMQSHGCRKRCRE